jgi:hypothetical protein
MQEHLQLIFLEMPLVRPGASKMVESGKSFANRPGIYCNLNLAPLW